MEYKPSHLSQIGTPVVGGQFYGIPYLDANSKWAQNGNFRWIVPNNTLQIGAGSPQVLNIIPLNGGTANPMMQASSFSINGDGSSYFSGSMTVGSGNYYCDASGNILTQGSAEFVRDVTCDANLFVNGMSSFDLGNIFTDGGGGLSCQWLDSSGSISTSSLDSSAITCATLSAGLITSYGIESTAGNGVGSIIGSVSSGNQTATISDTVIVTPATAGLFQASVYLLCISAGSAGTASCQLKFTDDSLVAQAVNPLPVSSISLTTAGNFAQASYTFNSKISVPIKYNTTVSGAVGAPKYSIRITITRLQ